MHDEIAGTGAGNADTMTPPHLQNGLLDLSKEIGQSGGLPAICAQINDKVELFLRQEAKTDMLRSTQEQTKISLGVISEALEKYRYVIGRAAERTEEVRSDRGRE